MLKEGCIAKLDHNTALLAKDDREIPIASSAAPIQAIGGKVIGVVLSFRDVTERRRAEEFKQSSQYARSLLEASLDPLVTISAEGKITDVNEAAIKVTGVAREKLVGTDYADYFTEPEKAQEGYQRVFSEGFVIDYPLTIHHADGHLTDVLYNASVYKDADGKVLGVFAAARDITAQKQASQYARSLLEASLDPLVTISAEGKITDVNEAAIKATGVKREKLVGTDFADYFTEPEKAREGYQRVFSEGFVIDYPLTIHHADGRLTDVLYNASVYKDFRGIVRGVFAAARDVTVLKQTEASLKESVAELARSNADLQQFAYVASHDLQEPLRTMSSFSQLLAQRYKGKLDADADDFIGFVVDGATRMQSLINDLLAFCGSAPGAVSCARRLRRSSPNRDGEPQCGHRGKQGRDHARPSAGAVRRRDAVGAAFSESDRQRHQVPAQHELNQ